MPKIFGMNILIILLAAVAFFMLGWLWYDALFGEQWQALTGVTDAMAEESMATSMPIGFLIGLLQAIGLAGIMSMKSEGGLKTGLKVGALAWLFFALPLSAYAWNYEGASFALLKIGAGYALVGYLLMGAIYGLFGKKA